MAAKKFKPARFTIEIDDPDDAQYFLEGLILAKSNNSSEYFVEMIDAVNQVLEVWRGQVLADQMEKRAAAGMP